jgi:tetratricopeptide (TPR) repeat protein
MGLFGGKNDVGSLVSKGHSLLQAGKSEQAAAKFKEATEVDPQHAEAWFCLGTIYSNSGQLESAIDCYTRCAQFAPPEKKAMPLFNMGNALQAMGQPDKALEVFKLATDLDPDFADAWINRGRLLDDAGHHAEAIDCYDRALALTPDDVVAHSNRGNSLRALGRFADARASYERALVLDSGDLAGQCGLGVCLGHLGQAEEGLRLIDQALEAVRYPPALAERATILAQLDRYDEALASVDEALQLGLDDLAAYNNRGEILAKLGEVEEAVASFDEGLKRDARYAPALFGKARVFCNAGRFPEAKATVDLYFQCSDAADALRPSAEAIVALCRNAGVA